MRERSTQSQFIRDTLTRAMKTYCDESNPDPMMASRSQISNMFNRVIDNDGVRKGVISPNLAKILKKKIYPIIGKHPSK